MNAFGRGYAAAVFATVVLSAVAISLAVLHGGTAPAAAFATLSLKASFDDAEAVRRLADEGIGAVVAESTQWVSVNDFGEIEKVPLAGYRDRIEAFDPRDDGYADKLRTLFVRGDRRYIYIPAVSAFGTAFMEDGVRGAVARAFADVDFSLSVGGLPLAFFVSMAALFASAALSIVLVGVPAFFAFALPALSSFAFFGPAGCVAAGFAFAALFSLRELADQWRRDRGSMSALWKRCRDGTLPDAPRAAVLMILAALASFIAAIPVLLTIAGWAGAAAAALTAHSFAFRVRAERGHARFVPIPLARASLDFRRESRVLSLFAAASLAALVASIPLVSGGERNLDGKEGKVPDFLNTVASGDYRRHVEFQRTFAALRLGSQEDEYRDYRLSAEGLVAVSASQEDSRSAVLSAGRFEIPPAERMLDCWSPDPTSAAVSRIAPHSILAVLLCAAAAVPALAAGAGGRRRAGHRFPYDERRIAA